MPLFLQRTPFYRILVAFIIGILLFSYLGLSVLIIPLFLVGVLCIASHYYVEQKNLHFNFRWLFGSGILLILISLGLYLSKQHEEKNRFENLGKQGLFQVEVTASPVNKPKTYLVKIKTTGFAADSIHFKPTQGNAILYIAKTSSSKSLRIGDQLLICGKLDAPKQYHNPEEFNYAKYLARKGIGATSYVDSIHWRLVKQSTEFSIFQYASDLRNKLLKVYKAHHIEGDEFAVLAALTLGYQDEIKDDLYASYSNSGAIHILSVSGLHVGIIYLVFMFLLSFLNKNTQTRILKSIVIIFLLWGYALLTGLSPSVMRATIMFSLVALATVVDAKSQIFNTLFLSAFLLLLYNPNYIFDVSFLLSYTAVLSIVYFHPRIKNLVHFNNKPLAWSWELFSVSIAAQIGTLPFCLYFFHKFSNYFLLTNFIAIPISTGIIYLALLLFIVSPFTILSQWISFALDWLLKAQNNSIIFIDKLPFSTFHTWINEFEAFLLFGIIILASAFVAKKRYVFIVGTLLCIITLQGSFLYRNWQSEKIEEVIVYANPKFTAIDFINKNSHYYFTTDSLKFKQTVEAFWLKNNLSEAIPIEQASNYKEGLFSFNGRSFCILSDSTFAHKTNMKQLHIDYLIVGGKPPLKLTDIENIFHTKNIIIDDTHSAWSTKKWIDACKKRGINCYALKEKGCLTLKL